MNNTFITTLFEAYNQFKRVGIFTSHEFHNNWMSRMKSICDKVENELESPNRIIDCTNRSFDEIEEQMYTFIKDLLKNGYPVHVAINVAQEKEIISISQPGYINPKIYDFSVKNLSKYFYDFFLSKAVYEGDPIQRFHAAPGSHWIFFSKVIHSFILENVKIEEIHNSNSNFISSTLFIIG